MPEFTMKMFSTKSLVITSTETTSTTITSSKPKTYTLTSLGKRNCVPLQAMGNKKCSSCGSKR
jgi:hypothetical protein